MARGAKAAEPAKKKVSVPEGSAPKARAKASEPVTTKVKPKGASAKPVAPAPKQTKAKPAASTTARSKAAPPAPKPAKAPVVTLKHLAAGVGETLDVPKRDAEAFALSLIGDLVARIKEGAKVRIAGLGVIEIKQRAARMGRNPATGEPVQIAASRKIAFRPAKELKEAV